MSAIPKPLAHFGIAIAIASGACEQIPFPAGVDRASVKVTVAETLEESLSQAPNLSVSVDSVFLSEIGPEQFEGHVEVLVRVNSLPPAILAEQDKMRGGAVYAWQTDATSVQLREKLVTLSILEQASPGQGYRCRIPILVRVDPSAGEHEVGVFVEYGDGELVGER